MKKPFNKLNVQDIADILCMYYNKFSFKEISNILQISDRAIRRVLKEKGISTRRKNRYIVRSNYFDNIKTEEQAYFLGLIYADGFVGNSDFNNISISLNIEDKYIIDLMAKQLIVYGLKPRLSKNKNMYVLNFSDKHMAETLRNKFKITQNKSIDLKSVLKEVPESLKRHTLRGYFDGDGAIFNRPSKSSFKKDDGSVSTYMYNYKGISICCTPSVAFEFKNYLDMGYIVETQNSKYVVYYNIYAQSEINLFYEIIYYDSSIYLERKHNGFI